MTGGRSLNRSARLLLSAAASLLAPAAASAQDATFRVRADFDAPLNADEGWAGEVGEAVTVPADQPFRLRMEGAPGKGDTLALQARRNGGPWETLEAHDFPYPQRELTLSFKGLAPGSTPPGWIVRSGAPGALSVAGEAEPLLSVTGGSKGLQALYDSPWLLPEFTYEARFRMAEGSPGFDMLFGYVDEMDHGLVRFNPHGGIEVVRVVGGEKIVLARQEVPLTRDWHEAEIELEEGRLTVSLDDDSVQLAAATTVSPHGLPGIAVPAGGAVELAELTIEGVPRTPRVSIVATRAYADGEPTRDLLPGSPSPFAPGFGISLDEQTAPWSAPETHGEFEWPLVIRRFGDGPVMNEPGDTFEFRMVDEAGQAVPGSAIAQVSLAVPPGHLGGTFVENPGRIGPWQASNGDLYFIMEPTESDNKFMMVKSADGGRSWHEVDGANRPATSDLESVDGRHIGGSIHILHQVTHSTRYHVFHTSDHPTHPDSWGIRDEVAARGKAIAQTASLAVRSDGSVVAFFLTDRLHYAIRGMDGAWSEAIAIDPEAGFINAGPQAIADGEDRVHLAYFSDDGRIWHRLLLPDGTLTQRTMLAEGAGASRAEYGAVLPLAYDPRSGTVLIAYRLADGTLWERRVRGDAPPSAPAMISDRPVVTDAVDSQQAGADLILNSETAHALFIDEETRSIFSTASNGGAWRAPQLRIGEISGSWVRGAVVRTEDRRLVYGFVYDAGSGGGAGLNRYAEIPLPAE